MENNKEFQDYLRKYADYYCNGNIEEAKKHQMVKQMEKYYADKQNN